MVTVDRPNLLNIPGLVGELIAAGQHPDRIAESDSRLEIDGDGLDSATVASVVAAHTGSPTVDQQREADADNARDAIVEQLVAKARRVWAGEDAFTQAQAQKILAGLVLIVARR